MANYVQMARSNYFRVKDEKAFLNFVEKYNLRMIEDGDGRVGIMDSEDSGCGGWPSEIYDEERDECIEIDFVAELRQHLADDQVCVLIEIGYEKMRVLTGRAIAIKRKGGTIVTDLADIYKKAEKAFGVKPTTAEY